MESRQRNESHFSQVFFCSSPQLAIAPKWASNHLFMFATIKNCIICLLLIHHARSHVRPPGDNKANHFYDNIFIQCVHFLLAESTEQITIIIIISKWSPWDSCSFPLKKWQTAFSTLAWFNRRRWIFATCSTYCSLLTAPINTSQAGSGIGGAFFLPPIPSAAAAKKKKEWKKYVKCVRIRRPTKSMTGHEENLTEGPHKKRSGK